MTANDATLAIVAPAITPELTGYAGVGEVGDDLGLESAGLAVGVSVDEARAVAVVVEVLGKVR
jgi:hypothetical protein